MTHIFATLGYTPEKVTHSITAEQDVERVVAFFGSRSNRGTRAALARLGTACRGLGLQLDEREIGSSYDFVAAASAYRVEAARVEPAATLFNTSGGTGVMQAAAAFVCFTTGIRMVYYNVEEQRYVHMPAVRLREAVAVTPQQARVLEALAPDAGGARPADVARRLRISPSTLDYHLKRLHAAGLVAYAEGQGTRRARVVITDAARLLHG